MDNKNKKGLTLIEVLVSVVITSMVMLYATSFFVAAFRLSTEEKEYASILEDVVNNLESYKFKGYGASESTAYITKEKKIRMGKYKVKYSLSRIGTPVNGVQYIVSNATWKYGDNSVTDASSNRISIKTAICSNWTHI